MKKTLLYVLALVAVLAVISACGKKEESSAPAATGPVSGELKITATNWQFDQKEYKVKKGDTMKVTLDSKEGAHAIKINGINVDVGTNKSKDVTFDKAGTYDIICSQPCGTGHATMKAKLIVE
ncbi:plastocyanin/azurin family copper-binding protein [Paenibacillus flagellatus]|uniref:Cytochrome C oxidase subunit II n=1 Tax=Paenibacillus flagellatus TaxID=2211139 RepID=A0A2V5KPK4_9BACL|nr:plastocyanin/azurin family copper-binding protein [Paenibacillus flagellatus]PYI53147.1 cytochrome C oxidase subunit II [Paenibacillus flagellatus]